MSREFWATERCVRDDLKRDFADAEHPLIDKFLSLRQQDPEPAGEHISRTKPKTLYKVDAIEHGVVWRGATFYDRRADIVYLIAAAQHRSGERDDFYQRLPQRLGRIYPTTKDEDQARLAAAQAKLADLCKRIDEVLAVGRSQGRATAWLPYCRVQLVCDQGIGLHAVRLDPRPDGDLTVRQAAHIAALFARAAGSTTRRSDRMWGDENPLPPGTFVFYF